MSGERVGKMLERVAREIHEQEYAEGTLRVLEERLGPLLRAGQAMRTRYLRHDATNDLADDAWDAALAALEREPG